MGRLKFGLSESVWLISLREFKELCPLQECESNQCEYAQSLPGQSILTAGFNDGTMEESAIYNHVERIIELRPPSDMHFKRCIANAVEKRVGIPHCTADKFFERIIIDYAYNFISITHLVKISNRTWTGININDVRLLRNPDGDEALMFQTPITVYQMDITRDMFTKRHPEHDLGQVQLDLLMDLLKAVK
jgi:hypothetical protein